MLSLTPTAVDDPISLELLTEYFGMRAETFPGQYRPVFPNREAFEPPAGVFLVAFDDDRAVGCGGIRRLVESRYEVKHLYLRSETRGRGWGRAVLAELEARARALGATELVLDTHHTLTAAAGLYASSGFEPTEAYNDNPNATRWYRKLLA